jgi:hypothetical protein
MDLAVRQLHPLFVGEVSGVDVVAQYELRRQSQL